MNSPWTENEGKKEGKEAVWGEVVREEKERERNTRRTNDSEALDNEQNLSISMHKLTTG